VIEAEEK